MAFSRSYLWFSPSICSPSSVAVAVERIKVRSPLNPNPKVHACLFKAVPWIPGGFQSRGFSRELARVASSRSNDVPGEVEGALTPKEELDGDEGGEAEVTRKPPWRRRRTKKKKGEETASSDIIRKEVAEEAGGAEVPKSGNVVFPLGSNSPELSVEESSSQPGGVVHHADSATRLKSSSFPTSREVVVNGAIGGAGTSNSGTEELEQVSVVLRKKKRRSKKDKEAGIVSNVVVSALDTEAEQLGRVSTERDSSNQSTQPKNTPEEVDLSAGEPVTLDVTPVTLGNVGESSSQSTKTNKRRLKKKPVVDSEREQASKNQEAENSTGGGADAAITEESTIKTTGNSTHEGEEQPSPQSWQGTSKVKKRKMRKKKAGGSQDQVVGSGEQAGDGSGGGSSNLDLRRQFSEEGLTPGDKGHDDGLHEAEREESQDRDNIQKNSQFNHTTDNSEASSPNDRSRNGSVITDSSNVQNQTPATGSDRGGTINDESVDPVRPAKKSRRRKQRKKKAPSLVKTESSRTEVGAPGAGDLYDSIVWCTVHLKVEAELDENERLYVVGANPELGGWDLSLALPLPESDEEGWWGNSLKIPRGTMLEYKYFTESQDEDSSVIVRWFGPEIQYCLPWKEGVGTEFEVIRDTWIPDVPAKLPLLAWGDRWWESDSMKESKDFASPEGLDEEQEFESRKVVNVEDEAVDVAKKKVETEEPVLEEWLKKKIRRKVFPREEPWLLESMIMDQRNGSARKKADETMEGAEGGTESVDVEQKDPDVQVEILINSPQCTMQRMAILEDGKLVELLLEPVNTRVQVGNVYLGVVRQLLPGMTGVFVDIGGFQLALLDITRNQYPYTFPQIGPSTDVPANGQFWGSSDNDEESDWEEADSGDEDEDDHDGDFVDDEEGDDEELDEDVEDDASRGRSTHLKGRGQDSREEDEEAKTDPKESNSLSIARSDSGSPGPITVNFGRKLKRWRKLQEGMQIIVEVKKESFGKKGPRLTAFPSLAGRFWVLIPGGNAVGVSRRITGPERKRLRQMAQDLLPANFSLTVRTEALGHDREELKKDLARLMETWKEILERASAAAVASEHGMEGAMPVLLHRAMGQFLTIVRDFFNDKVHRMVIDSPQCYQEVTSYLQEVAPQLSDRVELYTSKIPLFDAFSIESEIEKFSSRRVSLPNGGYLVLEETEALVSIDVNGGTSVLSHDVSQEEAILAVNLAAARQIATELRLRDIGGIIVVDFIDMADAKSEKMVLDEMRKAIARDRSCPSLCEISDFGLMEMTRKRVRPSVTLTISDTCAHCGGVGRVEAHETTLSKIERAVLRLLTTRPGNGNPSSSDSTKWPHFILRVDNEMGEYLKARKRKRMTQLSAALKVWLNLKVAVEFGTGQFQVLEQHRAGSEKRANGSGQTKSNQQSLGPGLLGKKGVWPGKRRRNFANQAILSFESPWPGFSLYTCDPLHHFQRVSLMRLRKPVLPL